MLGIMLCAKDIITKEAALLLPLTDARRIISGVSCYKRTRSNSSFHNCYELGTVI